MDEQLLHRSTCANAKASYGEYCVSSIASSAADGSIPFVLPDDDGNDNPEDGYTPPDGSLADYYDLSKHLNADRTTFDNGSECAVEATLATNTQVPTDATTTPTAQSAQLTGLSSSRALFASTQTAAGPKTLAVEEKVAGQNAPFATDAAATDESDLTSLWHSIANKHLSSVTSSDGTTPAIAIQDLEMMRPYDSTRQNATTGIDTISVAQAGGADTSAQDSYDQNGRNKNDQRENIANITSTAGAMAVKYDESGTTNAATGGDAVQTPQMQEISQAILEQMERMRNDPRKNSVSLSVDMADGTSCEVRLRWRGNHVKASFGESSLPMQGDIENGWASLAQRAGNTGMTLEPPSFNEATTAQLAVTNYYA